MHHPSFVGRSVVTWEVGDNHDLEFVNEHFPLAVGCAFFSQILPRTLGEHVNIGKVYCLGLRRFLHVEFGLGYKIEKEYVNSLSMLRNRKKRSD